MVKRAALYAMLTIFISTIIINPIETMQSAKNGVDLCLTTVVPSLLPFIVFNRILINTGFINAISRIFDRYIRAAFRISANAVSSVVLGITSGYPLGSKSAVTMLESSQITNIEFERVIAFCNNSGPLFIIGTIGGGMFHSRMCGVIIFLSHFISALIVGFLFRFYKAKKQDTKRTFLSHVITKKSFFNIFTDAVNDSMLTLLHICGYIVFFSVIICIFNLLGLIPSLSRLIAFTFDLDENVISGVLSGFFEITNGIKIIASTNASIALRLSLSSMVLGWGGLCVHAQTYGIMGNHNKKTYLIGKSLQAMFSLPITYCLCKLFRISIELPTFFQTKQGLAAFGQNLKISVWMFITYLLILLICWVSLFKEKQINP